MSNMVSSIVAGLGLDMRSNSPVMALKPENLQDERSLIIWIGAFEAAMISSVLLGAQPRRPMTHDLLLTVIKATGASLEKVSITALKHETFYAKLHMVIDGVETVIDARPSDAVARALRAEAPIWVEESLFTTEAKIVELDPGEQSGASGPVAEGPEALKERLRNLHPEDFGRTHL